MLKEKNFLPEILYSVEQGQTFSDKEEESLLPRRPQKERKDCSQKESDAKWKKCDSKRNEQQRKYKYEDKPVLTIENNINTVLWIEFKTRQNLIFKTRQSQNAQ